ncbi:MAG: ECF-type sigma factor [Akkermansiaceae bacterium]
MPNPEPASPNPSPERPSTEELFSIVYDELKKVANFKVSSEGPGQSLNATALVHEAYLRLEGTDHRFENPKHLFATASQAM